MNKREEALACFEAMKIAKRQFEHLTEEINLAIVQEIIPTPEIEQTKDILDSVEKTGKIINDLMAKRRKAADLCVSLAKQYDVLAREYNRERNERIRQG